MVMEVVQVVVGGRNEYENDQSGEYKGSETVRSFWGVCVEQN